MSPDREPRVSDERRLAEKVARGLFTNGAGEHAERLVLDFPGGRNGGGWCESAVADQIAAALAAARARCVQIEEALREVVNNAGCSCYEAAISTGPCARCRLAYEEARRALAEVEPPTETPEGA